MSGGHRPRDAVTGLAGQGWSAMRVQYVSGYSLLVWTILLLFLFVAAQAGNQRLSGPGPG